MKCKANLLFCAAGAMWLTAFGFVDLWGGALPDDGPAKKADSKEPAAPKERAKVDRAKSAARMRKADVKSATKEKVEMKTVLRKRAGLNNNADAGVGGMWNAAIKLLTGGAVDNAPNDPAVRQFEQQFAAPFRQLYRTELHFMRLVCQPSKQQYEKIAAGGETELKATTRKFAMMMRDRQHGGPMAASQEVDPRKPIADWLARSVKKNLAPDQAARYQKELEQRNAARKRAALLNLVAKLDKYLVLTVEQRDKLGKALEKNWSEAWGRTQIMMQGGQYFPQMPDNDILPVLTETQKTVWRGVQKVNFGWWFDFNGIQGIEIEEEVWDADPSKSDRKPARDEAAAKGKERAKTETKK